MGKKRTTPAPRGSIRGDEVLPLEVLRQRFRIGNKSVASMRRAGLPIRRLGRQGFVLGRDVLAFFAALPADGGEGEP